MRDFAPLLLSAFACAGACATAPKTEQSVDLLPWEDVADDGTAAPALVAAVTTVLAGDRRTADLRVVRGQHPLDAHGMYLRDEMLVELVPACDDDGRATAGALLKRSGAANWTLMIFQRYVDGAELDASLSFDEGRRALALTAHQSEIAEHRLAPIWIGRGTAHGRVSRPGCIAETEIAVELVSVDGDALRAAEHAVLCVSDDGSARFASWRPVLASP